MTISRRDALKCAAALLAAVPAVGHADATDASVPEPEPEPTAPLDHIILTAQGPGSDYVFSTWPGQGDAFSTTRFNFPHPEIRARLPRTPAVARFELAVAELVAEMDAAVPLPG